LVLTSAVNGAFHFIKSWPPPRQYGENEWVQLELRAVGDELTISVDGVSLGAIRDQSVPGPGGPMIYAESNGYFRNIVFIPLDGAAH
jgi:hypothetical protein